LARSSVRFEFFFAPYCSRFARALRKTEVCDAPTLQFVLSSPGEDNGAAYDVFGCSLHFSDLRTQTVCEVFKLTGQVHSPFVHALERLIVSGPVAVAVAMFADRAGPFEVVARPVETKRGKQARRSPGSFST
jgi:hypothetical protein